MSKKFNLYCKDKRFVFLISDPDQIPRMITAITEVQGGYLYDVAAGVDVSRHYDYEITTERDVTINLNLN